MKVNVKHRWKFLDKFKCLVKLYVSYLIMVRSLQLSCFALICSLEHWCTSEVICFETWKTLQHESISQADPVT